MNEILSLKKLIEFGIPMTVLARECHCTAASIQNYLSGRSLPSGSKLMGIKDGLRHIRTIIEESTRE